MHNVCSCHQPTNKCPRYGWMKGRKWEICRGQRVTPEERDALLDAFLKQKEQAGKAPSIIQKAGNLAHAVAEHAMNNFQKASDELIKERLEICKGCELLNQDSRTCTHAACGCYVDVKATWASEHCPMAKWPGDTEVLENKQRVSLPCVPCGK